MSLNYLFLFVFLFVLEILFISIAKFNNIFDQPGERSSHSVPIVRGGGIVFWFAALFYFIIHFPSEPVFMVALTIIAVTGLADDIKPRSQWFRLTGQLISITLIIIPVFFLNTETCSFLLPNTSSLSPQPCNLSIDLPDWLIITVIYILYTGILNAYNFMDGINGITGLYSISVLSALQYINFNITELTRPDFIWFSIIACAVFLFFNFRERALCFAGDTGSLTIGFWILYILLILILKTKSVVWILLLAVYGVDSVLTILHRLYLKQNIFQAHRLHFYQILANEKDIDHRIVSSVYAVIQAGISAAVINLWDRWPLWILGGVILIPLCAVYGLKFRLMKEKGIQ